MALIGNPVVTCCLRVARKVVSIEFIFSIKGTSGNLPLPREGTGPAVNASALPACHSNSNLGEGGFPYVP